MAKRILILDDDPGICKLIKIALERQGYETDHAHHPRDAWRQLQNSKPHLLVLDIDLPEMNGWGFTQRLRENDNLRDLPVVVVTGHSGFLNRAAAKLYGIAAVVPKPFNPRALCAIVREALQDEE